MRATTRPILGFVCLILCACGGGGGNPSGDEDAAPSDAGSADAYIVDAVVPDAARHVGPEIAVDPTTLALAAEAGMDSAPGAVTIRNVGTDPLHLQGLDFDSPSPEGSFTLPGAPALPATVEAGASLVVNAVWHAASADAQGHATLVIRSDDADEGEVRVAITGHVARRCVRAVPTSVELGPVTRGARSGVFRLSIVNCGDVPLDIAGVHVDGDMNFHWEPQGGADPAGTTLGPNVSLPLGVSYENMDLDADQPATATLVVDEAGGGTLVSVPLHAKGAPVDCLLTVTPDRADFGFVRMGTDGVLPIDIANTGSSACTLLGLDLQKLSGNDMNAFELTMDPGSGMVAAGEHRMAQLTYHAVADDARGDRAVLYVNYNDPAHMQNLRATVQVFGVGARAQAGPMPATLDFGQVTATTCGSHVLDAAAANLGQVPICVTSYRTEGEACGQFQLIEHPDVDGCLMLAPHESATFRFQFQPVDLALLRCTLVVETDAQDMADVRIPMRGEGVAMDATVDRFTVGHVDDDQRAWFDLSRQAVPDSIQVFVDDQPNMDWGYDGGRNGVYFEPGHHPAEHAAVRVEYDAICFERQ